MAGCLASLKIVGLEMFGTLQIAFFNLADQSFVNLYLSPLLDWRYMNGYNIAPKENTSANMSESRRLQQN